MVPSEVSPAFGYVTDLQSEMYAHCAAVLLSPNPAIVNIRVTAHPRAHLR